MDTTRIADIVAAIDPIAVIGFGTQDDLPGGLAVTALLLVVIAIWSLSGARGPRRTP